MIQISKSKKKFFWSIWSCCRQEYYTAGELNLFETFMLKFVASMIGSNVQLAPPTENVCGKA